MLAGETIVCFAPDPWAGLWRNRHQVMTRLARRNTVIYVEPRVYLGELRRKVAAGKVRWQDVAAPRLRWIRDGLYSYADPVYAPYAGRLTGGKITAALRRRSLRRALRRIQGAPHPAPRPILWLLRPWDVDQIGHFDEKLVVYQVTDEYSGFPTITDKAAFRRQEDAMLRRAGLVIVTSPALLAAKSGRNPHTYLVRNAVDYEGFQAALAAAPTPTPTPASAPPGIEALPHPRIGYVGALNEKIDYALLEDLARRQPGWRLVLVGALDLMQDPRRVDGLKALPNVHWIGRVPVEHVPLAIAGLDVCLLPYVCNPWTAHIDSLKLYEYLACGKPIVATDIPSVREFAGVVSVVPGDGTGADKEAFARAVAAALEDDSCARAEERRAVAAANIWDDRVSQIEQLLCEALERSHAL